MNKATAEVNGIPMGEKGFIGKKIGNYRVTLEINSGAFGRVYKAEHTHLKGRIVAIKLLHSYLGSSQERKQFLQEAQFLTQLEHPHILSLIDFGFHERQPYFIAEYAAGGSLRDLLQRQKLLPIKKAVTTLAQIGQALHYAHQQNIIHRDLKPENILFNAQGNALLADFGTAQILSTTSVKHLPTIGGTPLYMAPEQFQGIISKESDQYALGCIAYELVTGFRPFTAPDFFSIAFKHLTESPTMPRQLNSQIPTTIEAAILRALAKQRTERHPDIRSFIAALHAPFTQPPMLDIAQSTSPIQPTVPTSSATHAKEQWLTTGNGYYVAGRFNEALTAYEQAIRLDPNYTYAYYGKGNALNDLKRYQEAIAAYDVAIRLNPNYVDAYHSKGDTLVRLGQQREAEQAYKKARLLQNNHR